MSVANDIATYLQTSGVGTLGTDLFYGVVPATIETGVVVMETSGRSPDRYVPTKSPTFQVMIRSVDYDTGAAKMAAVRATLHKFVNTTINSTYYYYVMATSEGGHLGRDEGGHDLFSMNFETYTR